MSKSYLKCKFCKKFGACATFALETGSVFCHYGTGLSCLKWLIRGIPPMLLIVLNMWAIPTLGTTEVPFHGCDMGWVTVARIIIAIEVFGITISAIYGILQILECARKIGLRFFTQEYGCRSPKRCEKLHSSLSVGQALSCEGCTYRIKL